jgi:hypothetical protein
MPEAGSLANNYVMTYLSKGTTSEQHLAGDCSGTYGPAQRAPTLII